MFGLLLRSELLQGSAVRTWNCFINIANFFRYKLINIRVPVMPRSRRRHHSRSRSRSHSPHDRDVKRRRVDSPDTHSRRSVSVDNEVSTSTKTTPENFKSSKGTNPEIPIEILSDEPMSPDNIENVGAPPMDTTSLENLNIDDAPLKETTNLENLKTEDVLLKSMSPPPHKLDNVTPKKTRSPANIQKKLESEKKRKELHLEREKKRAEERKLKQEKEDQRRKEKEEREEARRKEREEKEAAKRREKEEREEEKRKIEEQKKKEREEKEEARRKEREEKEEIKRKIEEQRKEKEEQKRKEREERELKRQQEIEEKNREKKKKEEQQEKTKAAFVNFFVPRKSAGACDLKKPEEKLAFIPFEVKSDMRVAPLVRRKFSNTDKTNLVEKITEQLDKTLYLAELKRGKVVAKSTRTWPTGEDDDVVIIEDIGERVEEQATATKMKAKLLKFHLNRRPAFFGTWRKKSKHVTPRNPFALDKTVFDYEVDSDDDWEEEEPGESLSDDEEKANESADDYEVDNDFFVPHGYLSGDEEADDNDDEALNPETQKAKLKFLQLEFDEEMKSKTERIKPRLIGCIWEKKLVPRVQDAINTFLNAHTMIVNTSITIQKRDLLNTSVKIHPKLTPKRKKLTLEERNVLKQK